MFSKDFMTGFVFGMFVIGGVTVLSIYLIPNDCPDDYIKI